MRHRSPTADISDIIAIGGSGEHIKVSKKGAHLVSAECLSNDNPLPRIIAHIKHLVDVTAKQHKIRLEARSDSSHSVPLITRLVLNEFSLYTKDRPLTLDQYKNIIAAIDFFARNLEPNIHLVICTLPVLWPDDVLHNVGLYVQSPLKEGDFPILHHFDKRRPSPIDRCYVDTSKNAFYPLYGNNYVEKEYYDTGLSPNIVLAGTAIARNDVNQYRGALKVKVAAGKSILITTEICLEHFMGFGAKDTEILMEQLRVAGKKVPKKGSHVVSSYTIHLRENNLIAGVAQADPEILPEDPESRIRSESVFGSKWVLFTCKPKRTESIRTGNFQKDNEEPIMNRLIELERMLRLIEEMGIKRDSEAQAVDNQLSLRSNQ